LRAQNLLSLMKNTLIYWLGRAVVGFVGLLPLKLVAWLGRRTGGLVYFVDKRHRRVALNNLTMCFGREKSPAEITAIARENFRRLGENFACTIKTYLMPWEKLKSRVELVGMDNVLPRVPGPEAQSRIFAMGHFGLFEICTRYNKFVPFFHIASTYRALGQPGLNRLMVELRNRSGCELFERRTQGAELVAMMTRRGAMLGLITDQHAGPDGLRMNFLGHECSVSPAAAVFALRYRCPLHVTICYRTGLAKWRIENGRAIPTSINGRRRPIADVTRDVNAEFEAAVRRDPANWFWVHKRWKPAEPKPSRKPASEPSA
jgi:Kdo2-lipid IVA lauroyltransferase/acyltransferase